MKFLCEHCKAKYQIADEKVVGRTVRMKCRKCGGAIEVRAAVTETSVSVKASDVGAEGSSRPKAHGTTPPRPAPLATSLSGSARTAAPTRNASSGESALAGAFQRDVQREEQATSAGFDVRELSAADEWYVAVNGVPVGPVRVGEVRRKAAMGAVTEESLCWQEGMEEWRAIRTVTELAAVVREAAMGGRASALPPEPRPGVPSGPPRPGARGTGQHAAVSAREGSAREGGKAPAAPAWASRASGAAMEAQHPRDFSEEDAAPTIVGRSPLLEMEAAAAAVGHTPRPNGAFAATAVADPFRAPAPDPFRPAAPDPFKPVAAFGAGEGVAPVASPVAPPQPIVVAAPPRRFSAIGIGVIVMFACFGTMAAYFVFTKPPQPIVVNAATGPAAPTAAAPAPAPTDLPAVAPLAATQPATVGTGAKVASATPRSGGSQSTGAANPRSTNALATDPALRDLIASTGNGPAAGPGSTGGGGGGQLTEDEIKAVVTQHNLGVRRTCWDRSSTTTASVNVLVHIVIASSGQVSQANATGNDPVVAHCLEDEIKRWHWPGGGEVNVPFHFLRQ